MGSWFGCYMTHDSISFISYKLSVWHHKITIANGFSLSVSESHITLTLSLHLNNVLHVLKLTTNLISICKLTKDITAVLPFLIAIVYFRTEYRGRRLELLESRIGCIFLMMCGLLLLLRNSLLNQKKIHLNYLTFGFTIDI